MELTSKIPFTAKCGQRQNVTKKIAFKQIAPCESTGREILFEWPLHKILSSDSKVRATLENSIINSGSKKG